MDLRKPSVGAETANLGAEPIPQTVTLIVRDVFADITRTPYRTTTRRNVRVREFWVRTVRIRSGDGFHTVSNRIRRNACARAFRLRTVRTV
ncbi:hypothetical protein [Nesterenkonia sp. CF4.4]|uniref:hypothetical protein n=1 Tax=Nesterenkonia sp. CF4.4 TaxID=3373079 RepID=UPI003EE5A445